MKYVTKNPYDAEKLIEQAKKYIEEEANVELRKILPPRSRKQNAYFHAICGGFGVRFGYTMKDVKYDLIKRSLCREIFYVGKRTNILGEEEEVFRSTKALDTGEFTDVINRFRNYAACEGFYIPDPDDYKEAEMFRVFCEQQIEKNKDLLYMNGDED